MSQTSKDSYSKTTLVVIPTYNEVESLPIVVERLRAVLTPCDAHVLIVDDSSPDGTGEWAEHWAKSDEGGFVLHRPSKSGLASAYIDGFHWGTQRGYGFLAQMDADGSHRPEQMPKLIARMSGPDHPDLVIGSRWIRGGRISGWSASRQLLSRAGNFYIRLMLSVHARDATAGFRVYRSSSLMQSGILEAIGSSGYGFQMEMTDAAQRAGAVIAEVPITFEQRLLGESKLSSDIFWEELGMVTGRGLRRICGRG